MTRAAIRRGEWCEVPKSLTIDGQTLTLVQWAKVSGLNYNTLYYRIRGGVDPKEAVFNRLYEKRAPSPRPGFMRAKKRVLAPVRFDLGHLPRWGSVTSLTFRIAA